MEVQTVVSLREAACSLLDCKFNFCGPVLWTFSYFLCISFQKQTNRVYAETLCVNSGCAWVWKPQKREKNGIYFSIYCLLK